MCAYFKHQTDDLSKEPLELRLNVYVLTTSFEVDNVYITL